MIRTTSMDFDVPYIKKELEQIAKRTKIVDNSLDSANACADALNYYEKKYEDLTAFSFEYDFIDLFCGAGGLSAGLEQEGFMPIIAVDKDLSALKTYRFNRPWMKGENLIHEDIRNLVDKEIFPYVPVVVGGPPCQGFSVVNQHKKENDERNELYKFYVHAVNQSRPQIFLMENVEGILQIYDVIKEDFAAIDYITCTPIVLSPKEFGFPQSRRRAFLLGINKKYSQIADELFQIFRDTIAAHRIGVKYTLWDAIKDLPELQAKTLKNSTNVESSAWGYTVGGFCDASSDYSKLINRGLPDRLPILNHRTKYNNERDIKIYEVLKPGEKSDAESIQEINPYKNRADIFRDKFDKLAADEPCKTITAHMYYDCNMYIHPYQARGLTPREAARVQGFPDDYLFLGSPNEWYRQIGNAVSPLMARVLAVGLKQVLKRIEQGI